MLLFNLKKKMTKFVFCFWGFDFQLKKNPKTKEEGSKWEHTCFFFFLVS